VGFVLVNERTRSRLATHIEPAFEPARRRRGLLGRDGLAAGAALILAPCTAVHTCFMRFPIDILFVGRSGDVLGVRERVGPWRIAFAWRGFATIECAAGAIRRSGTVPGDRLQLQHS
jgi:hypothetical protein